jgi:DNA polymerase III subunit delta
MKIGPNRVREFLRDPGASTRAVLVYGPDAGLVNERADMVARTAVDDLADPFLVSEFSEGELLADRTRLTDEASALTFTGGRRVIKVRGVTDAASAVIEAYLAEGTGDALTVMRAGDLGPRSKVRRLFEESSNAAAVACYADDERMLDRVIRSTFSALNMSVTPDAITYLMANLGADRAVSRTELEKLIIYVGDAQEVTLDDAITCIGDSSAFNLDILAFAVGGGDQVAVDRAYARCLDEGTAPVAVLRVIQRHLTRLQLVVSESSKTGDVSRAVGALKPPIFFKFKDRFLGQVRAWTTHELGAALALLLDAEHAVKQTGAPAETICGHTLTRATEFANAGQTLRRTA